MRGRLALLLVISGCGRGSDDPATSFRLSTPELTIDAGQEKTLCWSTSIATSDKTAVRRFASKLSAGSHHVNLFEVSGFVTSPDGTVVDCESLGGGGSPIYVTQKADDELVLPDGVAIELQAGAHFVVQMHYLNPNAAPMRVQATIDLDLVPAGTPYTKANVFSGSAQAIDVPPKGTQSVSGSCFLPDDARFVLLTTHSHRFTKRAQILDGDRVVVDTGDWENATSVRFGAPYTFATGKASYRCDYENPTDDHVRFGASARTDEMCVAMGFFYPGQFPVLCTNDAP